MRKMRVIEVKRGLFMDCATLISDTFDECWCDTMLGTKHFWIDGQESVRVKLPKKLRANRGDTYSLSDIIKFSSFQAHIVFNWDWDD